MRESETTLTTEAPPNTPSPVVDAGARRIPGNRAPQPRRGLAQRLSAVIASHTLMDTYTAFVPPLVGVLEVRCKMTTAQTAWLLGIGTLTSGLVQPLAAWLSDRIDSRVAGALGLVLAAVCLSSVGLADSYPTILGLYVLGLIGSGIYHPIGAASMGQLADQLPGKRRALGISIFHCAGMVGGITGSIIAPRIAALPDGFATLRWLMIPGLVGAAALHLLIRSASHRHHEHRTIHFSRDDIRARWLVVMLVQMSSAMRATVNTAMIYLFVRWSQEIMAREHPAMGIADLATAAANINGNVNAWTIVGMAVGGLSTGALVRAGCEKWPMILIAVVFAPAIALFPRASLSVAYVLAAGAGIGFAATVPLSISLAQRLLPHRTSLASSLMLGGAWAVSFIGPSAAEWCLTTLRLSLSTTFLLNAGLLIVSSVVCLPISVGVLRASANVLKPRMDTDAHG